MMNQSDLVSAFETGRVTGIKLAAPVITTHISYIFLTDTHAYKLKRAVKLPFLDFSTLEKRHAACLAEYEVNQAMAADMYLSVRPVIALENGGYQIGGEGQITDWLVEMKRFAAGDQFDELARSGRLTAELLDATADTIARAHAYAAPIYLTGHATDYRGVVRELKETESQGADRLGLTIASETLYTALDREVTHLSGLIEARRKSGKVKRTHGDLHLRNMCLFEGKPTLFDALEFSEQLATTDVLYDLAYLLMDLVQLNLKPEANLVMNRYWDSAAEDEAALKLLPFFASLRASVRMAVAVEAERLPEADTYRKLAETLLHAPPPVAIAIGGLSGIGKSAVSRTIAARLPGPFGARWLRSDVLRKQDDSTPDYAEAARSGIYETLFTHAGGAFGAGLSVIMDATFQATQMQLDALNQHAMPVRGFWLTAPLDVRLLRISGRRNDPSDADAEIARAQQEPTLLPEGWARIDASGDVEAIVSDILGRLPVT